MSSRLTAGKAFTLLVLPAVFGSVAFAGTEKSSTIPKPRVECIALSGRKIPASKIGLPSGGVTITSAVVDPGTGNDISGPNSVPAFCKIDGTIAPVDPAGPPINFRVDIPVNWNRNAIQLGGNGFDGFIPNLAALARGLPGSPIGPAFPPDVAFPIAKGYAMYGSDGGHGGASAPNLDATPGPKVAGMGYMYAQHGTGAAGTAPPSRPFTANPAWWNNDESLNNFAHEAIKKTHDAATEIISEMYGVSPRFTYFMGESQGGREAACSPGLLP